MTARIEIMLFWGVVLCLLVSCQKIRLKSHHDVPEQRQVVDTLMFGIRKQVLGDLNDSGVVCAVFPFQNITSDTMYIDTVRVSCGCLNAQYPHAALPPGHKDSIVVRVDLSIVGTSFIKSAVAYFHHQQPVVLRVIGRKKKGKALDDE